LGLRSKEVRSLFFNFAYLFQGFRLFRFMYDLRCSRLDRLLYLLSKIVLLKNDRLEQCLSTTTVLITVTSSILSIIHLKDFAEHSRWFLDLFLII
jgi:hypothetical protein